LQKSLTSSQTRARKEVCTQPKKLGESSTGSVKRRVREEWANPTPKMKKIIISPVQTPSSSNKSSNPVEKSLKTKSRVSEYLFSDMDMELLSRGSSSSPLFTWKKQTKTLVKPSPVSKKDKANTPKTGTLTYLTTSFPPCRKKEKVTVKVDQLTPSCSTSCLNPSFSNINREDSRSSISKVQLQYPFEQFYSVR
jgi:hypothetical protein